MVIGREQVGAGSEPIFRSQEEEEGIQGVVSEEEIQKRAFIRSKEDYFLKRKHDTVCLCPNKNDGIVKKNLKLLERGDNFSVKLFSS